METEQEFVGVIQKQANLERTSRLSMLKHIYNDKFKKAYFLASHFNDLRYLPDSFPLSCPLDEEGLSNGIVALELQIKDEEERKSVVRY